MISILLWLDIGSKRWMETNLKSGESVTVLPNYLSWELIHNSGVSFGLFSGYTSILIVIQLILILVIVITYWKFEPKPFLMQFSFALLISGAIGNLIDRIQFGYVIDFIYFRWWPAIFNIADIEIRIGALVLVFLYLTQKMNWKINENKKESNIVKNLYRK